MSLIDYLDKGRPVLATLLVSLLANSLLIGVVVGDGLASWRVGRALTSHQAEPAHSDQVTRNATIETRMEFLEENQRAILAYQREQRDMLVRIQTTLGIEQRQE